MSNKLPKLTRCEKNLVRGRALDYLSRDISDYITHKEDLASAKDDQSRVHFEKVLKAFDRRISEKAFRFGLAAHCILSSVNDAFDAIEGYEIPDDFTDQKES